MCAWKKERKGRSAGAGGRRNPQSRGESEASLILCSGEDAYEWKWCSDVLELRWSSAFPAIKKDSCEATRGVGGMLGGVRSRKGRTTKIDAFGTSIKGDAARLEERKAESAKRKAC